MSQHWKEHCIKGDCVKSWSGSDPQCGFRNGLFERDWNCGIVSLIRGIIYAAREREEGYPGVHVQYCDDDWWAAINIDEVDEVEGETLWVAWYKNRGATEAMWILYRYKEPRRPSADDLLAIARAYNDLLQVDALEAQP